MILSVNLQPPTETVGEARKRFLETLAEANAKTSGTFTRSFLFFFQISAFSFPKSRAVRLACPTGKVNLTSISIQFQTPSRSSLPYYAVKSLARDWADVRELTVACLIGRGRAKIDPPRDPN